MKEEKKRIIKMVENGSLSAEEAIVLLEALENPESSTELSTSVNSDATGGYHHQQNKQEEPSFKAKVTDFLGGALKKVKEVDLDFNFGPSYTVSHIFQHGDALVSSLFMDISNGDVKLIPWKERDIRIECKATVYKVNNQDEARRHFLHDTSFSVENKKLHFSVQKKHMKVQTVCYIPEQQYEQASLRMFNGDIIGENLHINEVKAKTANGKVTLDRLTCRAIEIETVNGQIKATNLIGELVEMESLNGSIVTDGIFERIDLQSFSGSISCHAKQDCLHTVFLQSKAGNVDVTLPPKMEIDATLKTNLGKFYNYLENQETRLEKKEMLQKEWKFIGNKGATKRLQLEVETKAGSIYIKEGKE